MTARIAAPLESTQSPERGARGFEWSQHPSSLHVGFRSLELFLELRVAIGTNLSP